MFSSYIYNICETLFLYYNDLIFVLCRDREVPLQGLAFFCLPMTKLCLTAIHGNPRKTGSLLSGLKSALAGFCLAFKRLSNVPYMLVPAIKKLRTIPCLALLLLFFLLSLPPGGRVFAADADMVGGKVKQLTDKNTAKRLEAIAGLGKHKSAAAKKALRTELKKEKSAYMKSRLVDALACEQDEASTAELVNILKTETSPDVKISAVRGLGYSKDVSVTAVLIEKFLDQKENLGVRLQAANSLANYPTDEIFNVFAEALENTNIEIRKQAIVSMYNGFGWDKQRILPHVKKMLEDKGTEETAKQYLENLEVKLK